MSRWHRKARRDANHNEIVAALKAAGCSVVDLAACGGGVPDLLVGVSSGRRNLLLEVKRPGVAGKKRGKVQAGTNERQATFRDSWRGHVATVASVDEALRQVLDEQLVRDILDGRDSV